VWLDEGGLLHVGRCWVALPDTEWRLLAALVDRFGDLVTRDDLIRVTWPTTPVCGARLNTLVSRARRRLLPLGLTITTVRARGFVLHPTATSCCGMP